MLINLTNRTLNEWSELQLSEADRHFGAAADWALPVVNPLATSLDTSRLALTTFFEVRAAYPGRIKGVLFDEGGDPILKDTLLTLFKQKSIACFAYSESGQKGIFRPFERSEAYKIPQRWKLPGLINLFLTFRYAISKNWLQVLFLAGLVIWLTIVGNQTHFSFTGLPIIEAHDLGSVSKILNAIDPLIGITTLFLAFFVWFNEQRENYLEDLPKIMDVGFVYHGQVVMKCSNAPLSHQGDLRGWGQQIGRQLSNNEDLKFAPLFYITKKYPHLDQDARVVMLYSVHFLLNHLPGEARKGYDQGSCLTLETYSNRLTLTPLQPYHTTDRRHWLAKCRDWFLRHR
ncbi:MAG: hypothetical protein U0X91_27730 [Spirosomataceae bacterium]